MNKKSSPHFSWQKKFHLIKDYFINSDEKLVAWLLLLGIVLCVAGTVGVMTALSWCSAGFWAALTTKTITPFLISLVYTGLLSGAYVAVNVLKNLFISKLSIRWRNWLTKQTLNKLFNGENNYLDLKRCAETNNLSQCIQEDIKSFVSLNLQLGAGFLKSVLSLGAFIGTLWVVGGSLTLAVLGLTITIPGYMVWVALILSLTATLITHFIGKSLADKNKESECVEADLRQNLETITNDAENIAEEHAENYFKKILKTKVHDINENAHQILNTQSKLVAFQNFYIQFSGIFPLLVSAPLYFAGRIAVGQIMQISIAFGEVTSSLSWIVDAYEDLAKHKASADRIIELEHFFKKGGLKDNPRAISRKEKNKDIIKIKHLNIMPPKASSTSWIMKNINLKLIAGENTLITGTSGLGKSTLFKVISGTWPYGDGQITTPSGKHLYFLPQKPTLPKDTLMAVLAYPEPITNYSQDAYICALKAVGGMKNFISQLTEKKDWSQLSGGQQQRISVARALLKNPDWFFLDEATASLDEKSEQKIYKHLNSLKGKTIVSISHQSSVKKYHSREVFFSANNDKEITVTEKDVCSGDAKNDASVILKRS